MTALDLITASLRDLGVIASGEVATASEANDALTKLNLMLDSWNAERLMIYAILPTTFNFVAGKKTYTIGPSGDINMPRPARIDALTYQYTTNIAQPLIMQVELLDLDQYNSIAVPDIQTQLPTTAYINDNYPLRTMFLYPVPTQVWTASLFTWAPLTAVANLTSTIALPPGYAEALEYNLAVRMAPQYGVSPSSEVIQLAMDMRAKVKSLNSEPAPLMSVDTAIMPRRRPWNWRTGGYGRSGL